MKNTAAKWLPIGVGVAIGWLLFHPPAFLAPLGPLRHLVMLALGFVLLVAFIAALIAASLPAEVGLAPAEAEAPAAMQAVVDQLAALGFRPAGPLLRVAISPPATLVGLAHADQPVYATVFRTGTIPAVVSHDFVSILAGFRGGLTTMPDWRGGTLPAGEGGLRQVFPGADPETLFARHLDGLAYLRQRGLSCQPVSTGSFADDFRRSFARQRQVFLRAPLRNALIALARTTFKRVPCMGGLRDQPGAELQIRALQAGETRG